MNDEFNKRPKVAVADLVQTNANIFGGQMILVIQSHVFATEAGYNVSAAAVVGVNPV